jgi:hypothetical protein
LATVHRGSTRAGQLPTSAGANPVWMHDSRISGEP